MEHPLITQIERTGYPKEMLNQPECNGIDFYGSEILEGDDFAEYDGEIILKENLERLLSEMGFTFKTAI